MDLFFVGLYDPGAYTITYPLCYDDSRLYQKETGPLDPESRSCQVITSGQPLLIEYTPEEQEQIRRAPNLMRPTSLTRWP